MTIQEVLNTDQHRPWPYPQHRWRYYQEWNRLIFLHWRVNAETLRPFVPREMEIDLFEGDAWLSLVAFTMENVRPRMMPAVAMVSDFDEVNIRTYVVVNGRPAVYFLSMEAGKRISNALAARMSGFPYRYSRTRRRGNNYLLWNKEMHDRFRIEYEPGKAITDKSELELWLSERYTTFQDYKNLILEYDVHHIEWPLRQLHIKNLQVDYPRFRELVIGNPDLVGYSDGVQALAWDRKVHRF